MPLRCRIKKWAIHFVDDPFSFMQIFYTETSLVAIAVCKTAQQLQYFQVEPDQRHQQPKSAIPFHIFGRAHFLSRFYIVKIQHQHKSRDNANKKVENDTDHTVISPVQKGNIDVEETQYDVYEIKDRYPGNRR